MKHIKEFSGISAMPSREIVFMPDVKNRGVGECSGNQKHIKVVGAH